MTRDNCSSQDTTSQEVDLDHINRGTRGVTVEAHLLDNTLTSKVTRVPSDNTQTKRGDTWNSNRGCINSQTRGEVTMNSSSAMS